MCAYKIFNFFIIIYLCIVKTNRFIYFLFYKFNIFIITAKLNLFVFKRKKIEVLISKNDPSPIHSYFPRSSSNRDSIVCYIRIVIVLRTHHGAHGCTRPEQCYSYAM